MWYFFIDLGKEGKKGLCPLSVASVNYILLSTEHYFFLSLSSSSFYTLISFWEKFYFPKKKKKLIRFDHFRHQLDQFSKKIYRRYIIDHKFFLILSRRYLTHCQSPRSILFARHITQLKRVRLRKRSSAPPRSFSIFAFDRQIALYGSSINEICTCNAR